MTQSLKPMNITLLIKLLILSFIICLPKAPAGLHDDQVFSSFSKTKNNSFMLPTNVHFEHKVLKKIPLIEGSLPQAPSFHGVFAAIISNPIPAYSYSKTRHFISSSFARGPPQLS